MATAESLNDIGAKNAEGVKFLGGLIGTIANVGGVISLVLQVVKFFNGQPDPVEAALDKLVSVFITLDARTREEDIITKKAFVKLVLKDPLAVMATLDSLVKAQP